MSRKRRGREINVLEVKIDRAGYSDNDNVINNINITLKKGELVGLIGSNGAGKSTTIKAIIGLLPHVTGEVNVTGEYSRIAYIPEQPVLYENLTLWEHLKLAAAAHEIKRSTFIEQGENLLSVFFLQDVKHHFPTTFSKGMQQKVMIIIGLLIQPDVYVIDEPFVGLDPRAMTNFLEFLKKECQRGVGILISTHQLDIVERICDSVILIEDGHLLIQGTIDEIKDKCQLEEGTLLDCFHSLVES